MAGGKLDLGQECGAGKAPRFHGKDVEVYRGCGDSQTLKGENMPGGEDTGGLGSLPSAAQGYFNKLEAAVEGIPSSLKKTSPKTNLQPRTPPTPTCMHCSNIILQGTSGRVPETQTEGERGGEEGQGAEEGRVKNITLSFSHRCTAAQPASFLPLDLSTKRQSQRQGRRSKVSKVLKVKCNMKGCKH